jgi:hypothetical protein
MSCLGVHFALTESEAIKLKSFKDDSERLDYLQCEIEETYFSDHEEFIAESDKAWDAMHRSLSDGQLSYYDGPHPLRLAVIGGDPIYAKGDYIMSLKTPKEVADVASALAKILKEEFRKKYDAMDAKAYGCPKNAEDFEYTWKWLTGVGAFYQRAAAAGRYVLFSADQ